MANQDGQSRWPTKMAESVGTLLFKLFVLVLRLSPLKGGGWDKAVNVPLYALRCGAEAGVRELFMASVQLWPPGPIIDPGGLFN